MRVFGIPGTAVGLLLTLLALWSPAAATSFTLTKIMDSNTPIPGGSGNFIPSSLAFSLSGTYAVFEGQGSSGQKGIYFFNGTTVSRVADKSTPIPDGAGNFTDLQLYGVSAVSGNNVVFRGFGSSGQEGIYLFDGTTLRRVADKSTPIPDGTGNFTQFLSWRVSGANVAFRAHGPVAGGIGQQGVYFFNGTTQTLSRVADLNTPVPNASPAGNFSTFAGADPVLSGNNVAFRGVGSLGQEGIYFFNGSTLTLSRIADESTPIPNGTGNFTSLELFTSLPELSGANVVFFGQGSSGQSGHYFFNGTTQTLSRVLDLNTPIPNGTGNFSSFFDFFKDVSGDKVVVRALGNSGQQGIYLFDGTTLTLSRVADLNTPIPNGTGNFTGVGALPLVSGNNVAFVAEGSSSQSGVYFFDGSTLSVVADKNTAIPAGTGNFGPFFPPVLVSGANVAFVGHNASGTDHGLYLATSPSGTDCPSAFNFDFSGTEYGTCFRGALRSGDIKTGKDVSGTGHDSLVFTGGAGSAGGTWLTVYDSPTTPGPGPAFGAETLCVDVIFARFNNVKGAGVVALLNEGVDKLGLALVLSDAGNTDRLRLATLDGDPDKKGKLTFLPNTAVSLTNIALGTAIREHAWYRLVMTVDPTANTKVTGKVFSHEQDGDPNSALGLQIGQTLEYNGPLPAGVTSPGQNAILAQAVSAIVDLSVTNFSNDPAFCLGATQ